MPKRLSLQTDRRLQAISPSQPVSGRAHKLSAAFTIHLPLPLQLSSSSRPRKYPSQRICLATRRLLLPSSSRHVVAVVLRSPGCSVPARCIPHAPRRLDEGGRTPVSSLTQPRPHKLQISPCICRSCPPWGALSRPLVHSSGLVVVVVVSQSPFSPFVRGLWICPDQKHPTFFFFFCAPASGEFYNSSSSLCIRVLGLRTRTVLLLHGRRRVSRPSTTTLIEAWPLRPRPRIFSCRGREKPPRDPNKERRKHQLKQSPFYARYERDSSHTSISPTASYHCATSPADPRPHDALISRRGQRLTGHSSGETAASALLAERQNIGPGAPNETTAQGMTAQSQQ